MLDAVAGGWQVSGIVYLLSGQPLNLRYPDNAGILSDGQADFLGNVLKVDGFTTNMLIAWSLLLGSGGFVFFGWLSDKVGRKPIILGGCLIAALTYFPIFSALTHYANPALETALKNAPVVVTADPDKCQFLFNPTGTKKFTSSCDIARTVLANASVAYTNVAGARQKVTVRQGIERDLAKKIQGKLKDAKIKVDSQINGDKLRVTGKKRDDLQAAIALLRGEDFGLPLQFDNFRD